MSRIGKKPIVMPAGTKLEVKDNLVMVTGPKGALSRPMLEGLELNFEGDTVTVTRGSEDKRIRGFHGLMRTLIANMVEGVDKGFERKLEIVGIGYRAEVQGDNVVFYLGYSHPITFELPEGITAQIEKQTALTIRGINKELIGEVAAKMRGPEKA